jgi:hypothetical protein
MIWPFLSILINAFRFIPSQRVTFTGLIIDTIQLIFQIPIVKHLRLLAFLVFIRSRTESSLRQLCSVRGRVRHCNAFFNADALRAFKEFTGCANLNILRSKTDQTRKGHTIRFGRSKYRSKDVVYQLGLWMNVARLRPHPGCQNSFRRHA